MSLATAIQGARQGLNVAAITVDPSRRLSSLLELEPSDEQCKSVLAESLPKPVDVYYVDPSVVFQKFVAKHLKPELYDKLSNNGIYKQISQSLRETHNFAALYKMERVLENSNYDMVVLDTPPSHQVIDFFESPARLQKFFSSTQLSDKKGWLHWVQERGMSVAESFLKTLVGKEFVDEMDGFFRGVGDLRQQINITSKTFIKHMQKEDSKIILVFPPALDKIEDARFLTDELSRQDYRIDGFVLNRAYPEGLDFSKELEIPQDSTEKRLYDYYKDQKARSQEILQKIKRDTGSSSFFVTIPELEKPIESIADVENFSLAVQHYWDSRESI